MKGIILTYMTAALMTVPMTMAAVSNDSFSQLNYYGSDPQSSSSVIDALLSQQSDQSGIENADSDNTDTAAIISTVASLDTAVEITDVVSDGFYHDDPPLSRNVCALSSADARSKACGISYEESHALMMTSCNDAMDCVRGEACFLNVVCDTTTSTTTSTTTTSTTSTSAADDDFDISHYVMLGKDGEGETMTLANGSYQTTTTAATDEPPGSESFASLTMHSSNNNSGDSSSSSSSQTIASQIETIFTAVQSTVDDELFLSETPLSEWIPSSVYRFSGFYDGLKIMHSVGVAGKKLYIGANSNQDDFLKNGQVIETTKDCVHCFMYGLVNVAAFLAQAMKETIRYDACDENSWDRVGGRETYPIRSVLLLFIVVYYVVYCWLLLLHIVVVCVWLVCWSLCCIHGACLLVFVR